jgi:hypothetical protein
VCLQDVRSRAPPIPDNCCENDGAVDIAPSAAARGRGGGFEDPPYVMRNAEARRRFRRIDGRLRKPTHDVGFERRNINVARVEHCNGVRIVAERRQQMLQSYIGRTGCSRKFGATRQRCTEIRRHRNLSKISSSYAHDISRHAVKNGVKTSSHGKAIA